MVITQIIWSDKFKNEVTKIKDSKLKEKLQKQIQNLVECHELGKPLRYDIKCERTIYVKPYRLIYVHQGEQFCIFSDLNTKRRFTDNLVQQGQTKLKYTLPVKMNQK
jgi:tRNA uridine 5-carbamoylmethylation protein Kti12